MELLRVAELLFLVLICICSASMGFNSTCKESERKVLLLFKHTLTFEPYEQHRLDSWVGHDCCRWEGVGCDNVTGNVIKLDLGHLLFFFEVIGEVNPSLLELKSLRYLDLSFIDFQGSTFPEFFGSMRQLQYLGLSDTHFTGKIPRLLGNLTNLVYLGLQGACLGCGIEGNNLEWAFRLEKLDTLDLSLIDLSQALDTLHLLYKLPSLSELRLESCSLGNSHKLPTNSNISSTNLQQLDLGHNLFSGPIPLFIQNLSSIQSLDLSSNHLNSPISSWLGNKVNLENLFLEANHFRGSFPHFIQNMSSIKNLVLSSNQFNSPIPSWLGNKVDLEYLILAGNQFNGSFPNFIQRLSSLTSLDLSDNQFSSSIPSWLANNTSLKSLSLSNNEFNRVDGGIMNIIGSLCKLVGLDLSHNQLQEEVSGSQVNFSRCSIYESEHLERSTINLSYNNLDTLPPIILSLSSLESLDLSHNNIKTLPPLGELPYLFHLDLSHNNLSIVHQISLANLSGLTELDISSNSNSLLLDLSPDWMPPFQLHYLDILPCKLNSSFPKWILSQQSMAKLDLSDTGIYGALPHNIGNAMPDLRTLLLARNQMSGPIPSSLCRLAYLWDLDLQKNRFSGMIPDCWAANSQLVGVDLSLNKLSGRIPSSLADVSTLQLLRLSNNSLQGELPSQLSSSTSLAILDLSKNDLHGEIPPWNGANFPTLQILILRENRFNGTIPQQLCLFRALQIIDLARNNFVGTIPWCFGNFRGMGSYVQHSSNFSSSPPSPLASPPSPLASSTTTDVAQAPDVDPNDWSASEVIKGAEREYTSALHLLVNMDLSCNNLVGAIPAEISNSHSLIGLNLSHNLLNGTIPVEIGEMKSLESLDLSFNNLSGSIPEGISLLDSLSAMNLSFNNLQGSIPTSRHQQTLNDSSIYMGNPGLCGEPLSKKCFPDDTAHPPTGMVVEDEEDDKHEKMWLYLIIVFGFATGFWAVIGTLVVSKKWRYAYFGIAEELADWIYVRVAVRIAQANRRA